MGSYKFIDLFAGIGGIHLGFHQAGCECSFASEMNKFARSTYEKNMSKIDPGLFAAGQFKGDITQVDPVGIPDFDILTGGFPCQAFSHAGKRLGFADTRGTLFFNIANILRAKSPGAFFLENVRGLLNHDGGKTFETIRNVLTKDLGYTFAWKVIKASEFGLPQHRPRVYMVGFKDPAAQFEFPKPTGMALTMSDILGGKCDRQVGFTLRVGGRRSEISDRRNWDCYRVDGKETYLTIEQARRMQGFPEGFEFPVSETQAFKQLGNSVAVNVIAALAKEVVKTLDGLQTPGKAGGGQA